VTEPNEGDTELASVYEDLKAARERIARLEAGVRKLYWMLASNDTDFAKLSINSDDYDPKYTPDYSRETLLARQVLEPAKIFGPEWPVP
jgi:hypothetical protein